MNEEKQDFGVKLGKQLENPDFDFNKFCLYLCKISFLAYDFIKCYKENE